MNITELNYEIQKFDEENVERLLTEMGFNTNNYFITMTKPSLLKVALIGSLAGIANRYCIICFSETELNLIMTSRLTSKKLTELIKINRNEINKIKLSNILISYMLNVNTNESELNFQVFKKVGKFKKIKSSIELFKKMYML